MFGYRVPAPNEALLVSGRKQRGADALQFKIVTPGLKANPCSTIWATTGSV